MRYQLIESEKADCSIVRMCRLLGVSRSGYYAWRSRACSRRAAEDRDLAAVIARIHRSSRGTYGSPRICTELRDDGHDVGRRRVARLMKTQGLRGVPVRRFFRSKSEAEAVHIEPNLLDRRFTASSPDEVWLADITYLWTSEGWLHLAVILDLFSRRVIGWAMSQSPDADLSVRALDMAIARRGASPGTLHHSDRGCQYTCGAYRNRLAEHAMKVSMSRRGDCWDNAVVESFFATLKRELAHRSSWATREEARGDVFEYIEVFYNRIRRHTAIGSVSPEDFERLAA